MAVKWAVAAFVGCQLIWSACLAQSPFQEAPGPAPAKAARPHHNPGPPAAPDTVPPATAERVDWCLNSKANPADTKARANCLNDQAMGAIDEGHPGLAVDLADQAVRLEPNDPYHSDTRGEAYLAFGKPDEAMADFDRTIALGGNFPITYFCRGKIFEARGERDKAIAEYRRSLGAPAADDFEQNAQKQARSRLQALGVRP